MEELRNRLADFLSERLYQIIISNPRRKEEAFKVKVRPIMMKGSICFQETISKGTQVFHDNYEKDGMLDRLVRYMEEDFRQLEAQSMDGKLNVLVSKKGRMTIKQQKADSSQNQMMPDMSHNRSKQYILKEGVPVPFLIDLDVQTAEGTIIKSRYNKFKQINRYLEFVEDILPALPKERTIHIIDFGCGKSYLTFALYYYLHELKQLDVMITGLDLKTDVINKCNQLAERYGYDQLQFFQGDISTFQGAECVDMVVTLHACDTATDFAIKKAVDWGARVIFTVPCCQHEVNKQIENELLSPVFQYGLLKERISALLTDGIRANLLEEAGYETQVLEFISMEHTPKNILIRAVKRERDASVTNRRKSIEESGTALRQLTDALHVETTLQKLMKNNTL
ncbi:MAG: SAM-dependent methyltransferase [Bacillota bacterium]|nr:SAM-dependent methyltransferase [Bacillota bacterium]